MDRQKKSQPTKNRTTEQKIGQKRSGRLGSEEKKKGLNKNI